MQKCAVLKFGMFCLQSTKANGIRTLFEATGNNNTLHGSMLYDISGGHFTSHIVVLDVEHPRRMSESTSYLTQLSKAKADTFLKKA